jgi:hypothetical protein
VPQAFSAAFWPDLCQAMSTLSINLLGATCLTLRMSARSTTMPKAAIEQKISGQIGQPAACMMDITDGLFKGNS